MHNENTLVDQTMAKTNKLPTPLRFTTKLKAIFPYRAAQYNELARNVPHLQAHCYLSCQRVKSRDPNANSVRTNTKLRNTLERKLDVLFEFLRSL